LSPPAALAATTDDELVRFLVLLARATLGLAPRRHRVASAGGLALAAAERVVDRVHGDAACLRLHALPPVATGLADLDELGLAVADLADRGAAVDRHATHLGARQAQRGVVALLGHELHARAGAARHLAAGTRLDLDVVHRGADRDVAHRQRVADSDVRALPVLQLVADLDVARGDDVALLAV